MLRSLSRHCIQNSLSAVLVRPTPPLLGNIVLLIKGGIVAGETLIRRLTIRVAWSNCGEVDVTDPVQELGSEFIAGVAVASRCNQLLHRGPQFGGTGIEGAICRDIPTVVTEGWIVDGGVPVAGLPTPDAIAKQVGNIVIVSHAADAKDVLQIGDHFGILLADQNAINHICECLLVCDTILRPILADRLVILPVIPDGFGHARG